MIYGQNNTTNNKNNFWYSIIKLDWPLGNTVYYSYIWQMFDPNNPLSLKWLPIGLPVCEYVMFNQNSVFSCLKSLVTEKVPSELVLSNLTLLLPRSQALFSTMQQATVWHNSHWCFFLWSQTFRWWTREVNHSHTLGASRVALTPLIGHAVHSGCD